MIKLNSYGRSYVNYLVDGIDRSKCYPSVKRYVEEVEREVFEKGRSTEADIFKLRQIYFRTNDDTPPADPEYRLFEDEMAWKDSRVLPSK